MYYYNLWDKNINLLNILNREVSLSWTLNLYVTTYFNYKVFLSLAYSKIMNSHKDSILFKVKKTDMIHLYESHYWHVDTLFN